MKKHLLFPVVLLLLAFSSCVKEEPLANTDTTGQRTKSADALTAKDHIKIAVLSDIHYMDPSLLQGRAENQPLFKRYMVINSTKAMLPYSIPIFNKALSELIAQHPDIVLIAGDMAKDGEKISHEAVATSLERLTSAGIKVYITVGNNDINSTDARAYIGKDTVTVPNINPSEFTTTYADFGYGNAIAKDNPNSLSYVAQPYPGLWILSIDAELYRKESGKPRIKTETMDWIQQQMKTARENNITVLALMHRSLVEHFAGDNSDVFAGSAIDDWKTTANTLMDAGLRVIFTGHGHSSDIVIWEKDGKSLYDVKTGSLLTPPITYRIMTLKNKELDINTNRITSIDASLPEGQSLTEYSINTFSSLSEQLFTIAMSNTKRAIYVPSRLLSTAVPLARNAYIANMAGDEKLPPEERDKILAFAQLSPDSTKGAVNAILGLWTDPNTKDNKWHIKLINP